ncbi:tagatose 6-phosphate kinase [Symbiobacterium terraclitae]|uniref:Tagatose-6-phosphate kinase n=1 Tax=Symbiobacterium terraclitae TaxID=557451 RepID=A0ABS4JP69_9FIRM|nr:1-phosphofructokinase [Symbiobacterium terraclitae]MBP2017305.1 tagatose 6-phosphate kinase [Symbiobacterium terraclitae]
MERYVLTVTLNAAVDVAYTVPGFAAGAINVATAVRRVAGGKGNNVARVLARLGRRTVATGFAGGAAGRFIQDELRRCGVVPEYVEVAGESRTCFAITDPGSGVVTELRERGPELGPEDADRFKARFDRLLGGADLVVISGSVPPGVDAGIYRYLIERARTRQVRVILDSSGQPLREALSARPYLVKPNRAELADWAGQALAAEADVLAAARRMREAGPEWVLVSLGADGALLVGPEGSGGAWRAVPPQVRADNSVGSGDSAVAGLACALVRGDAPEGALRLAVACGTANALTPGVAEVHPADVERLAAEIRVERL